MFAEPSFTQKIWDRGIDIWASAIANTISGLVIAAIAGIAYFVKLELDLQHDARKQRQQSRIALELKQQQKSERIAAINLQLQKFMEELKEVQSGGQLQSLWDRISL